jgi:hypothetical protein
MAGIDVLTELDGAKAHSLYNGLTLWAEIRDLFDELNLWFEEVEVSITSHLPPSMLPLIRDDDFRSLGQG